ncbi:pleckstrin homology domain-containing family B member 1 isoform 1-T8 [Morphnus guianensis]
MALVKSGWLWRQSSILRRWKRNWFVLYLDGSLVYYHDETQRDMDGRIHVKYSCRDVKTGRECRDVQPPEGKSRDCLLTVVLRDGSKTTLCAESEDDAVAWKMAVLEAKSTPVRLHPPKQGCTIPARASGRAWVEVTPTQGLMLSSGWPPKTLRPLSKAPGARRGKRWRSVSDRAVRSGCHQRKMTERRVTLFSSLV